jgi:hypothetical protein
MLPQSINFYATRVISVSPKRAEPLARWTTENYVSLRVFWTVLDISRKYGASEISFKRCRSGGVVFDSKDCFKSKTAVVESET